MQRAADAVVTIVAYREGTSEVSSGTGVRLADGRVLTALRQLRGAARAEVFNADGDLIATAVALEVADMKLDLGVIGQVTGSGARITLARRSATQAQKVSLLGPRQGTRRAIDERTITRVAPADAGRALLRLGAEVGATAAGSPVVNARGELVAVALGGLAGRDDNDVAVDVSTIRDFIARPVSRLALPARDGTVAAARAPATEVRAATPAAAVARPGDPAARPRSSIFPERYGTAIGADTAGTWAVELFGCARLESRQRVYCYFRVTNLARGATFAVSGGDLADSTRRKVGGAENLVVGETVQRVAGWRTKAEVPLRELESVRVALEFPLPARDGDAVRLMVDVAGQRELWFGPFVLQRAP